MCVSISKVHVLSHLFLMYLVHASCNSLETTRPYAGAIRSRYEHTRHIYATTQAIIYIFKGGVPEYFEIHIYFISIQIHTAIPSPCVLASWASVLSDSESLRLIHLYKTHNMHRRDRCTEHTYLITNIS